MNRSPAPSPASLARAERDLAHWRSKLHAEIAKGSKSQLALVAVFTSNMLAASRVLDAR